MSDEIVDSVSNGPGDQTDPGSNETNPIDEALTSINQESAPRRFKVKVDGNDMEVDEDELLKGYQMSSASQKKFREAAELRKQVEDAIAIGQKDPARLLHMLGLDPKDFASSYLQKQIEEELLTPEERQQREREQELEAYRRRFKEQEENTKKAEQARMTQQIEEEMSNDILNVLMQSNVKPTPRVLARMAELMMASLNTQGSRATRATAKDAFSRVTQELQADLVEYATALPVQQLIQLLPGELIKALRQHFVNEVKSRVPSRSASRVSTPAKKDKGDSQSFEEAFGFKPL